MSWFSRTRATAAAVGFTAIAVVGCGGSGTARRGPAAEPAVSPPVSVKPAGRLVTVGTRPEGIVADPRTGSVAVAVRDPAEIVLLSTRTGAVIGRISIAGAPRHLSLAGPDGPVLVPEEPVDKLLELALAGGRSRSIAVGAHPHDAAADAGSVFVADEHGRNVAVVRGGMTVRRIGGFVQPGGVAAVGHDVAVVDVGAYTVTLLDARTLRALGHLRAGAGPTHVAAGPDGRIYVVDTRGNALIAYATRPRLALLGRVRLPGAPYGIASDPGAGRLWVTETARNRVVELGTRPAVPRRLASYPTGRQPNTVAVDPEDGRVFVADAAAGTIQIIDPGR